MDIDSVRWMLIDDWADIENTPRTERPPLRLERWHHRARELAITEQRQLIEVEDELQETARSVAARQRRELHIELARDLAACRALGHDLTPPWHRRLHRLAEVEGTPDETLRHAIENAAAAIQVVVAT
jgi:hypothetical protein